VWYAEILHERTPVELSAGVVVVQHALSRISGERHALFGPREIQKYPELYRRRILNFVDENVRKSHRPVVKTEHRAAEHLRASQEKREILGIERRLFAIAIDLRANSSLTNAPGVNLIKLPRAEAWLILKYLFE
jgi:hypothetical protein